MLILNRSFRSFEKRGVFKDQRLRAEDFSFFLAKRLPKRRFVSREVCFRGLNSFPKLFFFFPCVADLVGGNLRIPRFGKEERSDGNAA